MIDAPVNSTRDDAAISRQTGNCPEWLADARSPAEQTLLGRAFAIAQQIEPSAGWTGAAATLRRLDVDARAIAAAALYRVVKARPDALEQIRASLGPEVARLIDSALRLDTIDFSGNKQNRALQRQVEDVRRLLIALVDDVRVVLVWLAMGLQVLHNLRELDPQERGDAARKALHLYAPLAGRLGIWQLKWELEDLAFRELEPDAYQRVASQLHERRVDRERYITEVIETLSRQLDVAGIDAEVTGRPKHIHSIWKKMQSKSLDFAQLFDVRAVRVLVEGTDDCYAALALVHASWVPVTGEFDDYISNPKANRYQSLHTAVTGPRGKTLEVQIRTHTMHRHAEYGVAAHWQYKEGTHAQGSGSRRGKQPLAEKTVWLRQVLEDGERGGEFLAHFDNAAVQERVYVVTPTGHVIDLPRGATALDFAYRIHTDVGHRCRGAKVNGTIVPLGRELCSGDRVEILTHREERPSRDWLSQQHGYLKTSRARAKVRHWFKQQDYARNVATGREVWERELRRLSVELPDTTAIVARFNVGSLEALYAAIGSGNVSSGQIAGALRAAAKRERPQTDPAPAPPRRGGDGVQVEGVANLLTQIAGCCKPVPGDAIVGYLTRGHGVTVHRSSCATLQNLGREESERVTAVRWAAQDSRNYPVDLQIIAYEREGLLSEVSAAVGNEQVHLEAMERKVDDATLVATLRLRVSVTDLSQARRLLQRLRQIGNVLEARRQR